MKIYIITKMEHNDDYKRGETNYAVVKITQDKEKAYEFAHNEELKYMCLYDHVTDGKNDEDTRGLPIYNRDEKDETWEVSYGKLIKLLDEILEKPRYTMMACQERYSVEEHMVE
ncbi:hypothetical protein BGZ47_003515 [Haplosporangium gracile]|nr:hypothetical protein BGZ47_003515 [Haplosporangium gracile]